MQYAGSIHNVSDYSLHIKFILKYWILELQVHFKIVDSCTIPSMYESKKYHQEYILYYELLEL